MNEKVVFDLPACGVGESLGITGQDEGSDVLVYSGNFGFIFECHEVEVRQGAGGMTTIVRYLCRGEVIREDVTVNGNGNS